MNTTLHYTIVRMKTNTSGRQREREVEKKDEYDNVKVTSLEHTQEKTSTLKRTKLSIQGGGPFANE